MYCQLDDSCSYFVFTGGNCYLGDCSVTSQTLANQGSATVTYKAGLSISGLADCGNLFPENDQFTFHWGTYIWTSITTAGEPNCAILCLMHYLERCHFYAWINSRCYLGDFSNGGKTL